MHCGHSLGTHDIESVLKRKHTLFFNGAKDCVLSLKDLNSTVAKGVSVYWINDP